MKVLSIIKLMRVYKWYKNLVMLVPIYMAGQLFNQELFVSFVLGIIALCLISSINYTINDTIDVEKDKRSKSPRKRKKPLATGEISSREVVLVLVTLCVLGLPIAYEVGFMFFVGVLALMIVTNIYTTFLDDVKAMKYLIAPINFTIRGASGALLLGALPSAEQWIAIVVVAILLSGIIAWVRKGRLSV